jgi:hypothetical protein
MAAVCAAYTIFQGFVRWLAGVKTPANRLCPFKAAKSNRKSFDSGRCGGLRS